MRTLDRKMLRELWQIRAQVLAIVAVVGCGIGAFVAMASTLSSLERARDDFYAVSRFADVFAPLVRAPLSTAKLVAELPEVQAVEPRIVARANVQVAGFDEPVRGTMISLPEKGLRPTLHDLHLRQGRWPEPERDDEILVHEAFAEAHSLGPGDRIRAVLQGRLQTLRVVGVVLSAEFVYQVTPGTLFPDDERNGVFWMNERALGRAFDLDEAFNDLLVQLGRDGDEDAAIAAIDRILAPYGGTGAFPRADQGSNHMLTEELRGLRTQAILVPSIFLGVAGFLLQLVLGRIVVGQREVIAVMKALGYPTRRVLLHYLQLVAVVCLLGAAAGAMVGIGLGRLLIEAYEPYFRFPSLTFRLQGGVLLLGVVFAVAAGLAATVGTIRRIVGLPPAEAMKPPAPARFRPTVVERIGLGAHLSPAARMVLRRIERHPLRALLSSVGIALSLGILLTSGAMMATIDDLMDTVFRDEQRQDVTLSFFEPREESTIFEVARLPGVLRAEPMRNVAARLRNGVREESLALQGLPADGELRRILGRQRRVAGLPAGGLLLSAELARKLDVREGETIEVEVLEGERPRLRARIAGLVEDRLGLNAYIALDPLFLLLGEGRRISGANVLLDPRREGAFLRAVAETPGIAGAQLRSASLQVFEETSAATQNITSAIFILFASVIAIGVVYNTARIVLADSSRELASLRVLGFTRRETSAIFLGELGLLVLFALPLGWVVSFAFAALISANLPSELYRLTIRVPADAALRGVAIVLAAALLSALVVRRRLDRLDLVAVLKTRE